MDTDLRLYAAKLAAIAAAYYGAAKLGLDLAFETPSVTAIWPPTGIALTALILWGFRMWPGVALGAFLANSWTGVPIYTVLGITVGNTLEALVGAYLLHRIADFRPSLERVWDVFALAVLGGGVSTMVSATIGVGSLLVGDEIATGDVPSVWRTWWLGDMGGDLLVAPALMVAATHWPFDRAPGRRLEAVAMTLTVAGVGVLVFTQETSLVYLIFPPLIWAAMRFWQPGAAGASLLVAALAVVFTANEVGPFVGSDPDERLLLAQTFVGVAGVTALVLAVVVAERRRVEDTVQYIAGTLQESLLPSALPRIPGVEAAAHFQAAGEPYLVGGDFYDVFQARDGSWAVAVGDVCGKGAEAAAVTGLARYTMRAASTRESAPSRVLAALNDAVLRQRAPGEFCTVAYVRLELTGSSGARLAFATGGHPLPLVLRAAGSVEQLGTPGVVVGLEREASFDDHPAELGPGDALVLYTDGLTDAYAPGRFVSVDELTAVLESCSGREAREIAQGIRTEVLDDGGREPRDDIAILVLRLEPPVRGRDVVARIPCEPEAASRARDAIRELEPALERTLTSNLRLLVSELVTNSVRHAGLQPGTPLELRAVLLLDRVRVEVADPGGGFEPLPRTAGSDLASGWGLYLVEQLADRWGVEAEDETRVWFEIAR